MSYRSNTRPNVARKASPPKWLFSIDGIYTSNFTMGAAPQGIKGPAPWGPVRPDRELEPGVMTILAAQLHAIQSFSTPTCFVACMKFITHT